MRLGQATNHSSSSLPIIHAPNAAHIIAAGRIFAPMNTPAAAVTATPHTRLVAEVKGLIMDMTRKANSGHPGGAFSSADFACILFAEYLRLAPAHPQWPNRDRFVLSAGHESALLYGLLHVAGLLPRQELERFRQMGSLTPGHPEVHLTPGVEATTGPLGQGLANAVGMALAQRHQAATLSHTLISHYTYVLCGDGDLQEDVALGACALAGHHALEKLIVFYDKNDIQISGGTSRASSTNFTALFEAMQWRVLAIDGNDETAIRKALDAARQGDGRPTIIIGQTVMAKGTHSMEGSHKTHGEPLTVEEILSTKEKLLLTGTAFFAVSEATYAYMRTQTTRNNAAAAAWQTDLDAELKNPDFAARYHAVHNPSIPEGLALPALPPGTQQATRAAFGQALAALAPLLPSLMGGSADLEPSNNTAAFAAAVGELNATHPKGRNIAFGVREFAMGAICNGLALYGGVIPFGATFLVFSDYMRNAIRMSAVQELRVLHVFTHDSIFVGEDGPTHQPIEHTMSLRLIPNLHVMRPADAPETYACLLLALQSTHTPTALLLSRQNLPVLTGPSMGDATTGTAKGAYVKFETAPHLAPTCVVLATGSEVHIAIEAAQALLDSGHTGNIRVVSMPCWELFATQPPAYQQQVMAWECPARISIEAGSTTGWHRWVGHNGLTLGIDQFGYSAPGPQVAEKFGLTAGQVAQRIATYLEEVNGI